MLKILYTLAFFMAQYYFSGSNYVLPLHFSQFSQVRRISYGPHKSLNAMLFCRSLQLNDMHVQCLAHLYTRLVVRAVQ